MAGGAARRFGRNKLLEPFAGAPLFHRALYAVAAVSDEVLVVIAPGAELPLPSDGPPMLVVRDATSFEGPLAGTLAGLAAAQGETALVVGGDMPGLRPALLRLLAARLDAGSDEAVVLADAGGPRPLPAALRVVPARQRAFELLHTGERRLRALVSGAQVSVIGPNEWSAVDPSGEWRRDIDLPDDLTQGQGSR